MSMEEGIPRDRAARPAGIGGRGLSHAGTRPGWQDRRDPRRIAARPAPVRSNTDFERAFRHSGRVRFLRKFLPAVGLLALVAIIASFFIVNSQWPDFGIGGASIQQGKLVMAKPNLTGTDSKKRPFSLKAERAIQDADSPGKVALEEIEAKLPLDDSSFAQVEAGLGHYDMDRKTLRLENSITVDTDDGMHITLEDADIDLDSGVLVTTKPVSVETGEASISASSLRVEDRGKKIIFTDRVRMTIAASPAPEPRPVREGRAAESQE